MNSPDLQLSHQIWDSLQLPIMILAALGPVIIVILAIRFNRALKALKNKHQKEQEIFNKRMEVYERIVPKLHDIFSFFCYNGNWKEITPVYIMSVKKELDREISSFAPIFSNELGEKYSRFVQLCFVAHTGWEHEEKIKSHYDLRQEHIPEWREDWIYYFDPNNVVDAIRLKERYDELIESFKKDLNPLSV